ncbi:MAG: hypothetical protein IKF90_03915 [Parasporobacterium sp.]|nr:hypothetical protein [Parasporobacterium sp.]
MGKIKYSVAKRTIYYYGKATLKHWPFFLLDILSSVGYAYFLTFGNPLIIARIVDTITTVTVKADQIFSVFGPDILLLILCNVLGQVCSKLQDYSLWKLQILLPLVPLYVLILAIFLGIYIFVVYRIFKRLLKLNAETAGAQNRRMARF